MSFKSYWFDKKATEHFDEEGARCYLPSRAFILAAWILIAAVFAAIIGIITIYGPVQGSFMSN
jgi:hypothetical protein